MWSGGADGGGRVRQVGWSLHCHEACRSQDQSKGELKLKKNALAKL